MFNIFPYTNFHELNDDWIIKQIVQFNSDVQKLYEMFENDVQTKTEQYIDEHLSQFLLGAMYVPERTAIRLQPVEVLVDSDHVYMPSREEIKVLDKNDIHMEVR